MVKQSEKEEIFTASDGSRLAVWLTTQDPNSPTVVIIHGWLGTHNSGYTLSLANYLWQRGFNVARLNLRDHGGTSHLNEGMFHNGLIDEVVDVVKQLHKRFPHLGLAGFSLGGNFALRVSRQTGLPALGVSPLMDPAASVIAVDEGWSVYKKYFMKKWFKALNEKTIAHPHLYDFKSTGAYELNTVHDMTAHFVEHYTDYPTLQAYYDAYTLTGDYLLDANVAILAAEDDPVVPIAGFMNLPKNVQLTITSRGGHCAFIDSYRMTSYVDEFALSYFNQHL